MEQLRSLSALIEYAKKITQANGPKRISVVKADDPGLLGALEEARRDGIANFVLVGVQSQMAAAAKEAGVDLSNYRIMDVASEPEMALTAVKEVSSGNADIYMKGQIHTNHFLRGMLNKEVGLRNGKKTISHCYFHCIEGYDRIIFVADGVFNMYPDVAQKADIIKNAASLARACGVSEPKVACLAAVEVVNPDMPCTLDAAALAAMSRRGQISGCIVDGPFALDNAISEEAARTKGIISPVAGKADILLVPNIESGNILAKSIVYFTKNETAGLILGATAPIILTSRADSPRTKLLSIAAAVVLSSAGKK